MQPGRQLNACAAGRRTVAVTEGALQLFLAGRLPGDLFEAVLIHELGHHATRATRAGLATSWYAAPGRAAFRLVLTLAGARRVGAATAVVAAVAGAVATAQAIQQEQWMSVAILATLGVSLFVTPLLDGAISRASEYAADRYAAGVGAGPDLGRALTVLGGGHGFRTASRDASSSGTGRWLPGSRACPPRRRTLQRPGEQLGTRRTVGSRRDPACRQHPSTSKF